MYMQMKAQCDVYSREALISAIEAHDIISFDIFDGNKKEVQ